jgi:hypothetical protein
VLVGETRGPNNDGSWQLAAAKLNLEMNTKIYKLIGFGI